LCGHEATPHPQPAPLPPASWLCDMAAMVEVRGRQCEELLRFKPQRQQMQARSRHNFISASFTKFKFRFFKKIKKIYHISVFQKILKQKMQPTVYPTNVQKIMFKCFVFLVT
jgi:hypothetical protein